MGIRKEINDMIIERGGTPPVNGGIAASIDALSKLLNVGGGSGGGVSFKTFDLTLDDSTTMKITDMGNGMAHIHFMFMGSRIAYGSPDYGKILYSLPSDNTEFVEWMKNKQFVFAVTPFLNVANSEGDPEAQAGYGYIVMLGGANTELGNSMNLVPAPFDYTGLVDRELSTIVFDITVSAIQM